MSKTTATTYQKTYSTALPESVRSQMEGAFGADLSSVRVHPNSPNVQPGARAYTTGSDIHFGPGQYAPDSDAGRHLLAHELAHVVQQSGRNAMAASNAQLAAYAAAAGRSAGQLGV